ncbi:MAG: Spy/CpxP family protein refolding chaperone [Candidatus Melainabacteria bacterium]|nr:Spy/CpxP family protein refolding chaperone [Candidatus Melainabacteria bacterium]
MKRVQLGFSALALVFGLQFGASSACNSQVVPLSEAGVDIVEESPGSMIIDQVAEMPGGDTFAMRMRHAGHGFGGGMGMGASCPYLEGENKLTDEQFEKFYQIKNRMKDDMGSKMLEMGKLRRQFCDELNRESIDTKAVSKLEDRMASLKAETSKVFTSAALEMMNVLTPEQRKILRQKMVRGASMQHPMGHCGMGMGMGRNPGMMHHPGGGHHHKGGDK